MFQNAQLKNHFETSPTVQIRSNVVVEWNMNMPDNIFKLGNYRYRPQSSDTRYTTIQSTFDPNDVGQFYTGATDSDIIVDGGYDENEVPILYSSTKEKYNMYYSLEDCIKPFRPRSGINKLLYFNNKKIPHFSTDFVDAQGVFFTQRPRYYMPTRDDQFKYWTSYRTEKESAISTETTERGIAKRIVNNRFYIDDAAPFVVYKNNVPANRLVVKMQTNIGSVNSGSYVTPTGTISDPFYTEANKTTPTIWKVQALIGNQWVTIQDFNSTSARSDGTPIIKEDGYVELSYGLKIPTAFRNKFIHAETFSSTSLLPSESIDGYAYLVVSSTTDKGIYHVWNSSTKQYDQFVPEYTWFLTDDNLNQAKHFVTDFTSPNSFIEPATNMIKYREFEYVRGIRIVIDAMNKFESTFDLIEFSPRLLADISANVIDYNVKKSLGDLGSGALPIGQLLVSTGSISIFDDQQAFNENNQNSIIKDYLRKNIKFTFYETIVNVGGNDYTVPVKTLYSDGFPQADVTGATISIELRDFYFHFESLPAPELFITNVSLSYAIALLLDYVGFSNFIYKRNLAEVDQVIPYFFVGPDRNLAEVLNDLAVSTQTSMFFDEYNNFVIMSRNYLMPSATGQVLGGGLSTRTVDYELIGSKVTDKVSEIIIASQDAESYSSVATENLDAGAYNTTSWDLTIGSGSPSLIENTASIIKNKVITNKKLPNIISVASQDKKIYNNGKITYKSRYIDKTYSALGQETSLSEEDKRWVYKPTLLWQIGDTQELKKEGKTTGYSLSALTLNQDISNQPPSVVNHELINNIIDFGESIYLISRYQGYFYANGEVIKYDAVEYNISEIGNVWLSNESEYKYYLNKLPYNGKIYPTGRVRIFSEPYYVKINGVEKRQNGAVFKHGRAQFGTQITNHSSGLPSNWTDAANRKGCSMSSKYLFGSEVFQGTATVGAAAGVRTELAKRSTANGVIKKYLSKYDLTESEVLQINKIDPTKNKGVVQSSALVLKGPNFNTTFIQPIDFITYVHKPLEDRFKHFGTRMRIIGSSISDLQDEDGTVSKKIIPLDGTTYYQLNSESPNQSVNVSGNSGGIGVLVNPETNNGYYFEIISLDGGTNETANIVFYKIYSDASLTAVDGYGSQAFPELLWSGNGDILSDTGNFVGVARKFYENYDTVYDLSIEYIDNVENTNARRFFLYINNTLVATIDDKQPLPKYNNVALFTRGSSKCMFENVYALTENYSENSTVGITEPIANVFGGESININAGLRKYALSGVLQQTYLSGISAAEPNKFKVYFEEFGTIMRECAYFNIRFDNAYPSLFSKIIKLPERTKDYVVSGFQSSAYGAEFLIFNATDSLLDLGTTENNFLNISGIAFTQDGGGQLTVDDYFKKRSSFSDPELVASALVYSPTFEKQQYDNIRISRITYGNNEFSIESDYIQNPDDAELLMEWILNKLMVPKKAIGLNIFATPTIQLGDLVTIDYKNENGVDMVAPSSSKFIVYNIEYSRSNRGPSMTVYLSEV